MNLAAEYKNVLSEKLRLPKVLPEDKDFYQCAVYDYAADFDKFWADDKGQPAPEIIKAVSKSISKALIIVWGGMPDRCGFRMMKVNNDTELKERVKEFYSEFESKKKECAVLIVNSTSVPDKWTIAGFNDKEGFKRLLIDDPSSDLLVELKKVPTNENKIVELVTSNLGLTLPDYKLLMPHLTPLDWVLAFSIKVLKDADTAKKTDSMKTPSMENAPMVDLGFSIHIIDLTVKEFEDAYALRMRDQLLAEMPWMKLYAPLVPVVDVKKERKARYRRCYERITDLNALLEAVSKAETMADLIAEEKNSIQGTLGVVSNAWRASLIQSNDHHDLNNLIGATVASGGDDVSPLVRAFCKRLEFSGHLSRNYLSERKKLSSGAVDVGSADILVIDDMLSMGWDRYLCKALGTKHVVGTTFCSDKFVRFGTQGRVNLHGCLSANALIESWTPNPPRLDQRHFGHRFLPDTIYATYGEILFLDLRLGDQQKIKEQVSKLLDIFGSLLTNTDSLAWTAIDQDEQECIRKWCAEPNTSEDTDGFVDAITLLPRICALINPLVPIILFSSTARADIKQKLSSYRNIFCGFEKPQVLQQPESVLQSILGLRHQLRDCRKLIEFRHILAFVEEQAGYARPIRAMLAQTMKKFNSVECFFDESGVEKTGKLLSGTFVLLSDNHETADSINDSLNNIVDTKYSIFANTKYEVDEKILKRDKCAEKVKKALNSFSGRYQTLGIGFHVVDGLLTQFAGDLFTADHPERKLDYLLRFVIDFNGVVLPWYLGYSSEKAKFCFDVRSLPAKDKAEMSERFVRFGIEENTTGCMNKTFSEESYFPFIREAMLRWPNNLWKLNPHTARGYQLSAKNAGRHCHYLADWVVGALRDGGKGRKFLQAIVDEEHTYSAQATLNKFWLLESFRFAAHGASEEAIVHLLLHISIANSKAPRLDEPVNAKIEQILLLGIYDLALLSARGNALFQALFADKNSRKAGVQSSGIPEQYVDVKSEDETDSDMPLPPCDEESVSVQSPLPENGNTEVQITNNLALTDRVDQNEESGELLSEALMPVPIYAHIRAIRFNRDPRGWVVEDEAGVMYLLRKTCPTQSFALNERVNILPRNEFCVVVGEATRLADPVDN